MSGIYIPDMETPTTGLYFVGVDNSNGRDKTVITVERMLGNRDVRQIVGSFELVPVHDHGRLIDADALRHWILTETASLDTKGDREFVIDRLANELPTIISADKEDTE